MEKHAQNKLKMYKLVVKTCTENPAAIGGVGSLQAVLDALTQKVEDLELLAAEQAAVTLGIKEEKNKHRLATLAKLEGIAGALKALATATGDHVLKTKIAFTPSRLRTGSSLNTLLIIDRVIAAATTHSAQLQTSGIVPADIAELQLLRDGLDAQFLAVRNVIAERKTKTNDVRALIREIDQLLKGQLDNLLLVVRTTNPTFFDRYQAARMIVEYKGKTKGPGNSPDEPLPVTPPAGTR